MSEYTARNVSEVLKSATDKLHKTFRNSLKTLAGKFYADNLIPTEVKRNCSDGTIDKDTSTEALVSTLQDRVSNDPSAYYNIKEILENETGVSYIVKNIEDKRKELEAIEAEKKAEFERKKALEKREAELKNRHLQETPNQGKLFSLPGRPDTLPEAPPSVTPSTASSRNAPNSSFPLSNSGPAMYNRIFPTVTPVSQTPSSTQPGDLFPLPASSPGEMNYWIHRPKNPKTSFHALPPVNAYGTEHMVRHSLVTGMWTVGSLENGDSANTHQQVHTAHDNQNDTKTDESKNNFTESKTEQQPNYQKKDVRNETFKLSSERPTEDVTKQNQDEEIASSISAPNKEVTIDRHQSPRRSDSNGSNNSDNSCDSFGTATSSLSLEMSSEARGNSPRPRAKSCSKCAFYKRELQRLDEQVVELEKKCKSKDEAWQRQQLHHDKQIIVFTNEMQVRDYHLTVEHHRHQIMASKIDELQKKVISLNQIASSDTVMSLEATIKLQKEEIHTLKLERDRERREKEIVLLQKENERAEKENERKRFESERECRIAFETEVYQLRIELKRTRSFQCEENIFWYGTDDVEGLAAMLHSSNLTGSNPPYCTGANSLTNTTTSNQSLLPGCNQSLPQGHSECQGHKQNTQGHNQSVPQRFSQSMPQGHNQDVPQGFNQSMSQGHNQSTQGHNQSMPQEHTQSMPQGHTQSMPQGHNQSMPQGHTQSMPQGHNQSMPQGHTQIMPQGHNQSMPQGHTQSMPQGHNQSMPQGHTQIMPQGHNQSMPQGHTQSMPQGHNQSMPQGHTQIMPQGHHQNMPQGHNQSMPQGHDQSIVQRENLSLPSGYGMPTSQGPSMAKPNPSLRNWNNGNSGSIPAKLSQQRATAHPSTTFPHVTVQTYHNSQTTTGNFHSEALPSLHSAPSIDDNLTTDLHRTANSTTMDSEATGQRNQGHAKNANYNPRAPPT